MQKDPQGVREPPNEQVVANKFGIISPLPLVLLMSLNHWVSAYTCRWYHHRMQLFRFVRYDKDFKYLENKHICLSRSSCTIYFCLNITYFISVFWILFPYGSYFLLTWLLINEVHIGVGYIGSRYTVDPKMFSGQRT